MITAYVPKKGAHENVYAALEEEKTVTHPPHYTRGSIETIDYIEDKGLNFNLGNVVKYVSRAGYKEGNDIKVDLMKARWYLDREISRIDKYREKAADT